MKTAITKTALAAAFTAAMGVVSNGALAALFNPFSVTEASVPGALANPALLGNTVGKITGDYTEMATFSPISATTGTFAVSLLWNAGQYVAVNGSTVLASQLGNFSPNQYGMYALFEGSGGFVTSGGSTTFTFSPVGSLSLYIDPLSDTAFIAPATGSGAWTTGLSADDYLIAYGVPQSGTGTLTPGLSTCIGGGINCGSFGTTTSFALTTTGGPTPTANGAGYFVSPDPFYNFSFQSGQFDNFNPAAGGTQTVVGSLDAAFGAAIPEPGSVALLSIGLLSLAMTRTRRGK